MALYYIEHILNRYGTLRLVDNSEWKSLWGLQN